jgi:hypothetical protein
MNLPSNKKNTNAEGVKKNEIIFQAVYIPWQKVKKHFYFDLLVKLKFKVL